MNKFTFHFLNFSQSAIILFQLEVFQMTNTELIELLKRDASEICSIEGIEKKLEKGTSLKIKLGADPSRPDLHLGHSVVLRKLRLFQEMGHEIVFVIGDFTAMIGDPTGKSKTRPALTLDETRKSGETYYKQVTKILDPEKTRIVYNSEWLDKLTFADIISLTSKYTVARILERNDFSNRFQNNQPISIHELLYPLVQGYDSVALHADIEVGGTDQLFNLLVGRELQKDYNMEQQEIITFPLLTGLDGKEKMSKSLNNYIGIDESPLTMFEKAMKIPDSLLLEYFKLTTNFPVEYAEKLISLDIREAHFVYAREIIKYYHSEDDVIRAEKRYNTIGSGDIPEEVPVISLPKTKISIIDLVYSTSLAPSKSQARRLIEGNGIKVNNKKFNDINYVFEPSQEIVLQKGKSNFVKVIFE